MDAKPLNRPGGQVNGFNCKAAHFSTVGGAKILEFRGLEIDWKGHATVTVEDDGFRVAVDPYNGFVEEEADLVLVTHAHEGHFDREALEKVCGDATCLVVPESFRETDLPCRDVEYVSEDEVIDIYGVQIEAVPMYNEHHGEGEGFGYRFRMGDTSIYVAGDAGLMKEVSDLDSKVDLAFVPVEGVYTMDVDEAVRFAARVKPSVVVPYHYGAPFFEDVEVDLRGLEAALQDRNMRCEILEPHN